MGRLLAAILAAMLAGCASPKPPTTIPIAEPARAAHPCDKYKDPTTLARCRLFSSADGWQFIPPAGRSANLDTQLRCAPFRANLKHYEQCIAARSPTAPTIIALPRVDPSVAPPVTTLPVVTIRSAAPAVTAVPHAEPSAGPATADRLPPATVTSTRAQAVARTVQKEPAAFSTLLRQLTGSWPACAENGSCSGDLSAYTGRPKTVHVRGYYRKDGTYVRSHYRSRPRR
jgi:hypothetical protein